MICWLFCTHYGVGYEGYPALVLHGGEAGAVDDVGGQAEHEAGQHQEQGDGNLLLLQHAAVLRHVGVLPHPEEPNAPYYFSEVDERC